MTPDQITEAGALLKLHEKQRQQLVYLLGKPPSAGDNPRDQRTPAVISDVNLRVDEGGEVDNVSSFMPLAMLQAPTQGRYVPRLRLVSLDGMIDRAGLSDAAKHVLLDTLGEMIATEVARVIGMHVDATAERLRALGVQIDDTAPSDTPSLPSPGSQEL